MLKGGEDARVLEMVQAFSVAHGGGVIVPCQHAIRSSHADTEREVERLTRLGVYLGETRRLLGGDVLLEIGKRPLDSAGAAEVEEQPVPGLGRLLEPLKR